MELLRYISGPVIGSVIGYFTNYIAVKMLFFPRHEITIKGHVLPFTPGAIPKGKARLAAACGKVISNELLNKSEFERLLLSEDIEGRVIGGITEHLNKTLRDEIIGITDVSEEKYEAKKEQLCGILSEKIVESIDIYDLVNDQGADYFKEKAHSSKALGFIMTDKTIDKISNYLAGELQKVVDEKGVSYVQPIVAAKLNEIDGSTTEELFIAGGAKAERINEGLTDAYRRFVSENLESVVRHIDIAGIVTDKINAMSVEKMEQLVLQMMKKELSTIVNLGAVIGFLLGLFNLITSL